MNTHAESNADKALHAATNMPKSMAQQIEEVHSSIAELLFEIDFIVLQVNPQIEADYFIKIGCLENELLRAQIAARRAQRKVTLAQARVNSRMGIDETSLEATLDHEFEMWQQQLASRIENYLFMLEQHNGKRAMSPADEREFKALHRKLVKRLHPDLNHAQDSDAIRFFLIAQAAFEVGDIETLKSVDVATQYMTQLAVDENWTEDELNAEYELALAQLRITQERLDELKSQNPYAMGKKLDDPVWVCARTKVLQELIQEQEQVRALYEQRFIELKEFGNDDIQQ